jgi:glucan phosphoethanolaminetransferase (alkaline phosphatase superfamily)
MIHVLLDSSFWLKSILNFEESYIFRNYSILNSLTMHIKEHRKRRPRFTVSLLIMLQNLGFSVKWPKIHKICRFVYADVALATTSKKWRIVQHSARQPAAASSDG